MNLKSFLGSSVIGLNIFLIYCYVGVSSNHLSVMVNLTDGAIANYITKMKRYRKKRQHKMCFGCCKLKILLKLKYFIKFKQLPYNAASANSRTR